MQEVESLAEEVALVIIKPDGVLRGLTEEIISTFCQNGLELQYSQEINFSKEKARRFYSNKLNEPDLHQKLVEYLTSGPCIVLILTGKNTNARVRNIIGQIDSDSKGTGLRGKYGLNPLQDTIHGSRDMEEFYQSIEVLF